MLQMSGYYYTMLGVQGKIFIVGTELVYKNVWGGGGVWSSHIVWVALFTGGKWQERGTCDQGALLSCSVPEWQHAVQAKSPPGFE